MKFLKTLGFTMILIALAFLLAAALFWGLSIGTVKLPLDQIYNSVLEQLMGDLPIEAVGRGPVHDIVWLLRLPRLVLAALIGCGLAVCGVIMHRKKPSGGPLHFRHILRRVPWSHLCHPFGDRGVSGTELCGNQCIYRRFCSVTGSPLHIQPWGAVKFHETPPGRHGTLGGMQRFFQLHRVLCQ